MNLITNHRTPGERLADCVKPPPAEPWRTDFLNGDIIIKTFFVEEAWTGKSWVRFQVECVREGLNYVAPKPELHLFSNHIVEHCVRYNATDSGSSLRDSTNPVVEGGAE